MYGSRTKTIPTAPFDTVFDDPRTQTIDRRGFAELQYERHIDTRVSIRLRGAYDQYNYNGDYAYATGIFHDSAHSKWVTAEASVVRQFSRHGLTVGTEYLRNLQQDQGAHDGIRVVLDDRRRSVNAALYAEDEFRVSARVIVNAGLRWDEYYGIFGSTVNPRIALIVTPVAGSTVKALYGRPFRTPNPFELYYDQNALSAQLKPERMQTYELTWEQHLGARLQASASLFSNHVRGLITESSGSDTIDGLYYTNSDDVKAEGVEFELQGEVPGRVHARIAQSFQGPSRDAIGARFSNSPDRLSTIVLDAPIPRTDAFIAFDAFDAFGIGDRLRTGNGFVVPGAFVGNLSLSWRPTGKGFGAGLAAYNVFNTAYADPGSVEHAQRVIPQDGRTRSVRLAWRF
jgi:iron complex outermembrane receptor protein